MALSVMSHAAWRRQDTARAPEPCATIAPDAVITEIGAFSDMQYTAEHEYGHIVMLWRAGACVFGLFEANQGLQGDTPIGELQKVMHNPATGEFSFSVKLTLGATGVPGGKMEPTHDLFTFVGTLGATRLVGGLEHIVQNAVNAKPERVPAMLPASPSNTDVMHGTSTYRAWREKWDPILKFRGPKW
jgi:hypothetical protein